MAAKKTASTYEEAIKKLKAVVIAESYGNHFACMNNERTP